MIIEIDLRTHAGREQFAAAHPAARFVRTDGTVFLDTGVSERYLRRKSELATQLGKSPSELTQEDWERFEEEEAAPIDDRGVREDDEYDDT